MYHHAKQPTPIRWTLTGAVWTVGLIAVVARGLDNFTTFTLREPFDTISYVLAVTCWAAGPLMLVQLLVTAQRQRSAELAEENRRLRDYHQRLDQLADAVRKTDEQGEVNAVLLRKVLKILNDQQIPVGDTQEIPRRLHGIPGGGGA